MASTTKIMTGLLVVENADPDELVTISARAANVGEKEIDLVAGEELTVDALFKALMIHSANDAAIALAEHISGSVAEFVALMNDRAAELGLVGTRFANPHGLDDLDHHSTAADLLALTRVAMSHPAFAVTVRARALTFPAAPDGTARSGQATNLLLGDYEGAIGVKTGFTNQAQLTFVATAEREGRRIYVVVLGSEGTRAHFADATALLDYAFGEFGFVGALTLKSSYQPITRPLARSPLSVSAESEVMIHVAALGLMVGDAPGQPAQPVAEDPVTVISRQSTQGPSSIVDALRHWLDRLAAGG